MTGVFDRQAWFKGGAARCSSHPTPPNQLYKLVLLGAPGVGKGTQAKLLCARLGCCHLSTGDIFRAAGHAADAELSPELKIALLKMRAGDLVSDDIVVALIRARGQCLRCLRGFVLDGFPRTAGQAKALHKMLEIENVGLNAAVYYHVSPVTLMQRLSGRRTCPRCKAIFHLTSQPPQIDGLCDHCGASLVQREDDQPEAVRVRMQAYEQTIAPLLEFYRAQGLLVSVNATSPEETFQNTLAALTKNCQPRDQRMP